jgi:hypothetical protein
MPFSKSGLILGIKLSEHHVIESEHGMRPHTKLSIHGRSYCQRHLILNGIFSQQALLFRFLQFLYRFLRDDEGNRLLAGFRRLFLEFLHGESAVFLVVFVYEPSSRRIQMESFGSFVEGVKLFVDEVYEFQSFLGKRIDTSMEILLYLRLEFFYSSENDIQ